MKAPADRRDWGESVALLVAFLVFVGSRGRYTLGGQTVTLILSWTVGLELAALIVTTLVGARTVAQILMKTVAAVLVAGLLLSLARVVHMVVYNSNGIDGARLLETAMMIIVCNIIIFAVIYHEAGEAQFLFPRRNDDDDAPHVFLDYLFLSFTTSTAFSPTDTAPLTTRARMFMMVESTISLVTIAIAAARAVNILT